MRFALLLCVVWPVVAQFRTTAPLVVAPTTVTDGAGRLIVGLTEKNFAVYDNGVLQRIHVDDNLNPISLVVIVQNSASSEAILDKLGRSASLFTEYLAAEGGETALTVRQ